MPVDFAISIPKSDMARLDNSIATIQHKLGLSLPQALRWTVQAVTRSLAASTKIAPKRRKVEQRIEEFDRYTKRGKLMKKRGKVKTWGYYRFDRGEKKETWRPFRDQPKGKSEANKHPSAQINMRGLAKAAWWWGGKKAGGNLGRMPAGRKATQRATQVGIYQEQLEGRTPQITVGTKLGYMRKALQNGPKDVSTAIDRAARGLLHRMNVALKKAVESK